MENNIIILTNNSLVKEKYPFTKMLEGDYIDVLTKARDLVHINYSLISHPLPASIRIFYSPVRSIILRKGFSEKSIGVIDDSIAAYKKTMGIRKSDTRNKKDYEKIDLILLDQAISESNILAKEGNL